MEKPVERRFGNYRFLIEREHKGEGANGKVYLAEGVEGKYKGKQVAIKVLKAPLTNENIKDFVIEAGVCQLLRHEHIIRLHDIGLLDDHTPFLIMDFAPKGSLRNLHQQGSRLSLESALSYTKSIASALQYAHDKGVVHRDIKPENILLGEQNKVLVSDFGIAAISFTRNYDELLNITGTLPYMAPEQFIGEAQSASDQYSLAVVVYEWICGARPFNGRSFGEFAKKHKEENPPSLRKINAVIPLEVEQVVLRALAKDPKDRFASVQEFANALEQALLPPRRIALFGYETEGGRNSVLWNNPQLYFSNGEYAERYSAWSKTKRDFTEEEILDGIWVKASENGHALMVRFLPKGDLIESALFDPGTQWNGSWRLLDGVLRVNIGDYELDVFANHDSSLHSGIEFQKGQSTPWSYFTVFHTKTLDANQWNQWGGKTNLELIMSLLIHRYRDARLYLDDVRRRLGSPTSTELEAVPSPYRTTGRVQRFEGGPGDPKGASVYSSKYGTYPTWGGIAQCYEDRGGTSGRLGFPTSPELEAVPSPQGTAGQVQRFEDNASVYCHGHEAYPTWGGIGRCYEDLGGTGSVLGFPTSAELEANRSPQETAGWVQRFEGGDMYWCEEFDGVPVRGTILTIYERSGGSGRDFGFPKSLETSDPDHPNHYMQEFEGGVIRDYTEEVER